MKSHASTQRVDQAIEQGHYSKLGAITGTQLAHGIHHVAFNGFHRDAKTGGDGLVGDDVKSH